MANYVDVKPELLRWAVDRSGRPAEEYREAVAKWLAGDAKPTYKQLESFAQRAMVPFGYLFLDEPPVEELPVPDYRTRTDDGVSHPTPNLIETIFEMQRRQEWMREYLLEEGHEPLPFVGSAEVGDRVAAVAQQMRDELDLTDTWAEQQASYEDALRFLREQIEAAGILIFINGIVGNSTRRKLDPDEFQGFVFVDDIAPLVFVNGADFKVAQMFTIAHELAHVWTGQSALFTLAATQPADVGVEKYCNRVAAEFLVPGEKLDEAWRDASGGDQVFTAIARKFKVSPIVVARRAKDRKLISLDEFFSFYRRYMEREEKKVERKKPGGSFWNNQNTRIGRRFGQAVVTAVLTGRLPYTDAYELTGLRGETFDKYAGRVLGGGV